MAIISDDPRQDGFIARLSIRGQPKNLFSFQQIIRFVDSECRQVCAVACEEDEHILSSHAINPGGTFTFEADNSKATFSATAARRSNQGRPRMRQEVTIRSFMRIG
jgi:hypothetical protein